MTRCEWAQANKLLSVDHDEHWGVPVYDDKQLFEQLILEGAQAGLSWSIILQKKAAYKSAFDNFDPYVIAHYDEAKLNALINNPNIVRNKLKIRSVVTNAQAYMSICQQQSSFSEYLWNFVDGKRIINHWQTAQQVPTVSAQSQAMSKGLKSYGFKFVGATTCYAFMQAVGMVNDHLVTCFRHKQC
jgi:DNA-3-methyladenine glycosylase I